MKPQTKTLKTGVKVYLDEKENITKVTSPYDSNEYYNQPLKF